MIARIPLILEPQPEGGYTVTSPLLPELITEGDTIAECLVNAEGRLCGSPRNLRRPRTSTARRHLYGRRQRASVY